MRKFQLILSLAAVALLSGCETQTKKDCKAFVSAGAAVNAVRDKKPAKKADVETLVKELTAAKATIGAARAGIKAPEMVAGMQHLEQRLDERIVLMRKAFDTSAAPAASAAAPSDPRQAALRAAADAAVKGMVGDDPLAPGILHLLVENAGAISEANSEAMDVCLK